MEDVYEIANELYGTKKIVEFFDQLS